MKELYGKLDPYNVTFMNFYTMTLKYEFG